MLRKYTIHIGDNNLHNVYQLTILTADDTTEEQVIAYTKVLYPNTPVIKVASEVSMTKGYLVSEEFVGKVRV